MSTTNWEHTMNLSFAFESPQQADIARRTLNVDKELKEDQVKRELEVKDNQLLVTFQCHTVRMLRVAVNSFLEFLHLVTLTIKEFELKE
ncbi:transcription factor Pcc1 [Basidiobolus meristosporus CBS 931.73]|uniref:Transcription factor Pcc1 n=1 Tax=Basidiobolus meristosporus CBS 931.73 TaxID=1314790 RepID=A0A1Y1Z8L1_9FUNG|nr:transcription factor Pcc1 [Basidiobolus meristosporus CBS 931.73]|eukprot:ORY06610.1 transcription factor Pcc1 [Basidiobolus meristosporus CBS 931.73]